MRKADLKRGLASLTNAISAEKPIIPVTGQVFAHLAGEVELDPTKVDEDNVEIVKAITNALTVSGKGRRRLAIPLEVAQYLAAGIAAPQVAPPTNPEQQSSAGGPDTNSDPDPVATSQPSTPQGSASKRSSKARK